MFLSSANISSQWLLPRSIELKVRKITQMTPPLLQEGTHEPTSTVATHEQPSVAELQEQQGFVNLTAKEECHLQMQQEQTQGLEGGCGVYFDSVLCWPRTPPATEAVLPCPDSFHGLPYDSSRECLPPGLLLPTVPVNVLPHPQRMRPGTATWTGGGTTTPTTTCANTWQREWATLMPLWSCPRTSTAWATW